MGQSRWEQSGRSPTDEALEAYFRNTSNFHAGMRTQDIVKVMGDFDEYDDWDWGRLVYEWRRPHFRVRVCTDADAVVVVEALSPTTLGRFDSAVEELWQHPTYRGRY